MKTRRPFQHYDLCEVVWDDAAGLKHGWTAKHEKVEPYIALSVGFLIVDTPGHIIIAQDTDGEGSHNGRTQIPRGMVKRLKVLRKRDEAKNADPEADSGGNAGGSRSS
jgi:hypothetical protein